MWVEVEMGFHLNIYIKWVGWEYIYIYTHTLIVAV